MPWTDAWGQRNQIDEGSHSSSWPTRADYCIPARRVHTSRQFLVVVVVMARRLPICIIRRPFVRRTSSDVPDPSQKHIRPNTHRQRVSSYTTWISDPSPSSSAQSTGLNALLCTLNWLHTTSPHLVKAVNLSHRRDPKLTEAAGLPGSGFQAPPPLPPGSPTKGTMCGVYRASKYLYTLLPCVQTPLFAETTGRRDPRSSPLWSLLSLLKVVPQG